MEANAGFVIGIISFFASFAAFASPETAGGVIGLAISTLGFSIAGKILAGKSAASGFVGTPTKLGKVFGLIGIILGGIAFTFGLIGAAGM